MLNAHLGTALIALGLLAFGCSSSDSNGGGSTSVTTCSDPFTACGGDASGTWNIKNICVEGTLLQALDDQLGTASCSGAFTEAGIQFSGQVNYTGDNFTRKGSIEITAKMRLSPQCFADQLGGTALSASSCGSFQYVIPSAHPGTTATCSFESPNCVCNTNSTEAIDQSGTFSVGASVINESSGNSYDYCVQGSQMAQRGKVGNVVNGVALWTKG